MITHIFHIADLHIRSGNTEQSRFNEFKIVFDRLIEDIKAHPSIATGNAIVVVAGDVFHHKLRIESPGLKLSLEFFKNLGMLCPTYVIRGNHDYRQDKPDEPDLIQTFLHLQNVFYIDNTCTQVVDNIGFGIITVQDALQKGSTSGMAHELLKFPEPIFDDDRVTHRIGLFHGDISKYPANWLPPGYDLFLLGDIHTQQVMNASPCKTNNSNFRPKHSNAVSQYQYACNDLVCGYAGSLIQQDFGENLMGHGFLLWNIEEKTVEQYHIKNDFGFVTARLDTGKDAWDIAVKQKNKWQPLAALVHQPWFPKHISLRVVYDSESTPALLKRAKDDFNNMNINIIHITPMTVTPDIAMTSQTTSQDDHMNDLVSFNTPTAWIEYIVDKMSDYNDDAAIDWRDWFNNPETLQVASCVNEHLGKKVDERNTKIMKKIKEYTDTTNERKISKSNFTMRYMAWDWVLCFREGNWFNFEDMKTHKIAVVSAKNGVGKTSLLETMCIALYGEGFPSRSSKTFTSSIICQEKPDTEKAHTSLVVNLGSDTYRIKRVFTTSNADVTKMTTVAKETSIDRVILEDDGVHKFVNLYSGKTSVDNWVDMHIGDIRSFLMSCMVTQNGDCDFFNMKSVDQKEMLDQALDIESCTHFQNVLKESKLAHTAILELTETAISCVNRYEDASTYGSVEEIEDEIEGEKVKLDTVKDTYKDIMLSTPKDVDISSYDPELTFDEDCDESDLALVRQELYNLLQVCSDVDVENHHYLKKEHIEPPVVPLKEKQYVVSEIMRIRNQGVVTPSAKDINSLDVLISAFDGDLSGNVGNVLSRYNEILEKYNGVEVKHTQEMPVTPKMSKEDASRICVGEKPCKVKLDENTSIDTLNKEIQDLSKQLVRILSDQPPKNETRVTKDVEVLEKEIEDTCSETNVTKLQAIIDNLEKIYEKHSTITEHINDVKHNIEQLHNMPYNDTCWACNKQPWKLQQNNYVDKLTQMKSEESVLKKQMKKYSGAGDPLEYIQVLKAHINNINQLESYKWDTYVKEKTSISNKLSEREQQLKWLEWKEACNAINSWNALDDWIELDKDVKNLEEFKSSLLHERILAGKLFLLEEELNAINTVQENAMIKKAKELYKSMSTIQAHLHARKCKTTHELYEKAQAVSKDIQDIESKIVDLELKRRVKIEDDIKLHELHILNSYASMIRSRLKLVEHVFTMFSGFKQWVYANKVIPYLTNFTNNIVSTICDTRHIQLIGKMVGNNPCWFIGDTHISPIEKSSGFQKFILGLAIRIALSKFGTTGMLSMQLFIDEGFTACDSENISKIPRFLNNLLSMYPHGIMLVSHMDDIKICAKMNVNLSRGLLEGTTNCQYGSKLFS